jgi:transcriptional regulator with XRE-family HTH domain
MARRLHYRVMHGRDRLRLWIARTQLSQRQVARLFGVHYTFVNQMLSGRRSPGIRVAVTIERETGIPVGAWMPTAEGKNAKGTPGRAKTRKVA